ncbi:uncharacterized protein LOC117827349 [Xyrichtys novacula]|uniref:Uncharacterized protein LOC117827349 n=1 Tax=Xyrichtys novacula TaxID=13765 RepID=A0AAV1FGJ0_XYRNO|nr:uncharacterized protein LOC117827349 [Xyrichtys novacula]
MKRRCVPLRADHNLLTPDRHTQSGVRLHPAVQARLEAIASSSEHLTDSSSSESAVTTRSQRQRHVVASLPRRLRFEDETETEAESRYLERLRQRRGAGTRGTGVLVPKPDLNLLLNSNVGAGPQGAGPVVGGHQKRWLSGGQVGQNDSCRTILVGGVNLNLCLRPPEDHGHRLYKSRLNLRTEPIRETYIGSVSYDEPFRGGDTSRGVTDNQVRRTRTSLKEVNGNHMTISEATPTSDLPINPYAPETLATPTQPSGCPTPVFTCHRTSAGPPETSAMTSRCIQPNSTKARKTQLQDRNQTRNQDRKSNQNQDRNQDRKLNPNQDRKQRQNQERNRDRNQNQVQDKNLNQIKEEIQTKNQDKTQIQDVLSKPALTRPQRELCLGAEPKGRSRCREVRTTSPASSAESQAPPTSDGNSNGQLKQPMRAEPAVDDISLPEHSMSRDEPARLSLRRLFANVKLSRNRAASLDRLSSRPRPSPPSQTQPESAPYSAAKSSSLLKRTPSFQSLNVGVPFLPLRKSSSVQSLWSEQKKKRRDRSADYKPAADQCVHRCVSVEDVSCPSSVRSVGRVLQVYSDGTILLEISRLKNRTFGFIISRGRGRPDSGVYVEDMVDSGTQKLYSGLLAVGDEILEVNGEKVACLSLDQVTHLLTQNTTATVRVLRRLQVLPR